MARTELVLQTRDVAMLRRAHNALSAVLAAFDPTSAASDAPHTPRARRRRRRKPGAKPTGAAAHKRNRKPKTYPAAYIDADPVLAAAAANAEHAAAAS